MPLGYLCLVLHAHLPFVRHPEYDDFLEEDWLYEAITETYIPLLDVFDGLERDGVEWRMTMSVTPTLAAKAVLSDGLSAVATDLDGAKVDDAFLATLQQFGLAGSKAETSDFTVTVTTPSSLWFVTDSVSSATYDVRLGEDPNTGFNVLDVYLQFGLSITIRSPGNDWKVADSVNAMTFEITKAATSSTLTVQQLSSWMPLRAWKCRRRKYGALPRSSAWRAPSSSTNSTASDRILSGRSTTFMRCSAAQPSLCNCPSEASAISKGLSIWSP